MKHYAVNVKAFATIYVQAEDENRALEAIEHMDFGNLQLDEGTAKELTDERDVDSERRHADLRLCITEHSIRHLQP